MFVRKLNITYIFKIGTLSRICFYSYNTHTNEINQSKYIYMRNKSYFFHVYFNISNIRTIGFNIETTFLCIALLLLPLVCCIDCFLS